jgi:hypothetical protein
VKSVTEDSGTTHRPVLASAPWAVKGEAELFPNQVQQVTIPAPTTQDYSPCSSANSSKRPGGGVGVGDLDVNRISLAVLVSEETAASSRFRTRGDGDCSPISWRGSGDPSPWCGDLGSSGDWESICCKITKFVGSNDIKVSNVDECR